MGGIQGLINRTTGVSGRGARARTAGRIARAARRRSRGGAGG